jgi:hypothetical protein
MASLTNIQIISLLGCFYKCGCRYINTAIKLEKSIEPAATTQREKAVNNYSSDGESSRIAKHEGADYSNSILSIIISKIIFSR